MAILDYIRSRMEDGDPEFDLDWEIAREMANDRAESRFAAKKPTLSASVGNANLSMTKRSTGTGESVASSKSISQSAASSQARFSFGSVGPSKLGDGKQRYYEVPFAKAVDKIVKAKKPIGDEHVFVSETPEVFSKIGFPRLPIMMTQKHVLSISSDADSLKALKISGNAHDMKNVLKQIPKALQKPLMVIASKSKPDVGVVAITRLVDKDGRSVIVPVAINGLSRIGGGAQIDAHIMTSAYGKDNAWSKLVVDAIEAEAQGKVGVFYIDNTRASMIRNQLARAMKNQKPGTSRLQLPSGSFASDFVHSITDPGSPVNTVGMVDQTASRQFKKWFGKSKVVNRAGQPLVVYHGTPNGKFWTFDKKGNETIINFYSDRKTENGGQRPHPVLTTASKEIVSQNAANSQGVIMD